MYVKLRPGANPQDLENKLVALRDTYLVSYLEKTGDPSTADFKKYFSYKLEPITDIHLNPAHISDDHRHGDILYVWLFGVLPSSFSRWRVSTSSTFLPPSGKPC